MEFGPQTTDKQLIFLCDELNIPLQAIVYKNELDVMDIKKERTNGAYIINMADSAKVEGDELIPNKGTHWVAFFIKKPNAFVFDSYGIDAPQAIQKFLAGLKTYYNPYQIQDFDDGYCGQFCVAFLAFMTKNPTKRGYYHFLRQFNVI